MKITLKNRFNDEPIFTYECENNTIKITLEKAVEKGIKIFYPDLSGADLRGANLENAYLYAKMVDANLSGANLKNSRIFADLSKAELSGADLSNAYICSEFVLANLTGVNFANAHFMGSDFSLANMTDVNLTNAYFINSNLVESGLDIELASNNGAIFLACQTIKSN